MLDIQDRSPTRPCQQQSEGQNASSARQNCPCNVEKPCRRRLSTSSHSERDYSSTLHQCSSENPQENPRQTGQPLSDTGCYQLSKPTPGQGHAAQHTHQSLPNICYQSQPLAPGPRPLPAGRQAEASLH